MEGRHGRGFTLIEMLVVIAIISILASILFPTFSKAQEKARQADCASNIRQLGMAVKMYEQDFDGQFPVAFVDTGQGRGDWYDCWRLFVHPYVHNTAVHKCRSHSSLPGTFPTYGSYGMNIHVSGISSGGMYDTASTILLAETGGAPAAVDPNTFDPAVHDPLMEVVARHNEGANFQFVDGHVKWYRIAGTVSPDNLWDVN
jgi:prepilin-type N-terminal cleavage/methylation domain-containing protein/prepilin-type processing-associated H-X9-DG protein